VQRQQEYARAIQERNKLEHLSRPTKPVKNLHEAQEENDEHLRRRRAVS